MSQKKNLPTPVPGDSHGNEPPLPDSFYVICEENGFVLFNPNKNEDIHLNKLKILALYVNIKDADLFTHNGVNTIFLDAKKIREIGSLPNFIKDKLRFAYKYDIVDVIKSNVNVRASSKPNFYLLTIVPSEGYQSCAIQIETDNPESLIKLEFRLRRHQCYAGRLTLGGLLKEALVYNGNMSLVDFMAKRALEISKSKYDEKKEEEVSPPSAPKLYSSSNANEGIKRCSSFKLCFHSYNTRTNTNKKAALLLNTNKRANRENVGISLDCSSSSSSSSSSFGVSPQKRMALPLGNSCDDESNDAQNSKDFSDRNNRVYFSGTHPSLPPGSPKCKRFNLSKGNKQVLKIDISTSNDNSCVDDSDSLSASGIPVSSNAHSNDNESNDNENEGDNNGIEDSTDLSEDPSPPTKHKNSYVSRSPDVRGCERSSNNNSAQYSTPCGVCVVPQQCQPSSVALHRPFQFRVQPQAQQSFGNNNNYTQQAQPVNFCLSTTTAACSVPGTTIIWQQQSFGNSNYTQQARLVTTFAYQQQQQPAQFQVQQPFGYNAYGNCY